MLQFPNLIIGTTRHCLENIQFYDNIAKFLILQKSWSFTKCVWDIMSGTPVYKENQLKQVNPVQCYRAISVLYKSCVGIHVYCLIKKALKDLVSLPNKNRMA